MSLSNTCPEPTLMPLERGIRSAMLSVDARAMNAGARTKRQVADDAMVMMRAPTRIPVPIWGKQWGSPMTAVRTGLLFAVR
jgi:hypothetical protein